MQKISGKTKHFTLKMCFACNSSLVWEPKSVRKMKQLYDKCNSINRY